MMFENLLLQNKTTILKRWFDLILETYPADTVTLMRKEQNQFKNPVGATFSREIETLFKQLCEGVQNGQCRASVDAILKIRSVQDFSPSKAVGFIFQLKKAIEETLRSEICREQNIEAWRAFQSKIDALALQAFDAYMNCREKICEIRVNQAKAEKEMALRMMERLNPSKEETAERKRLIVTNNRKFKCQMSKVKGMTNAQMSKYARCKFLHIVEPHLHPRPHCIEWQRERGNAQCRIPNF